MFGAGQRIVPQFQYFQYPFIYKNQSLEMKRQGIRNFSNVVFPKRSSHYRFLQKENRNESINMSSKSQNKSTKSISPIKKGHPQNPFITHFAKIEQYRQKSKVTFSAEMASQINERLEIKQIVQKGFEQRAKNGELFIDDTKNPFTEQLKKASKNISDILSKPGSQKKTVLSQLARVKANINKSPINNKLLKQTQHLRQLNRQYQHFRDMRSRKMDLHDLRIRFQLGKDPQYKQKVRDQFAQFQKMTQTQEQSFFDKQRQTKSLNIFRIINNRNHHDFNSNIECLDRLSFTHDSIVSINHTERQKFQIHYLEDISTYMRQIMKCSSKKKNQKSQNFKVRQYDCRMIIDRLEFQDVILIANGRLQSQVLQRYMMQETKSKTKEELQREKQNDKENKIDYKNTSVNRSINCDIFDNSKTDVMSLQKNELSALERQQQQLSRTFREKLVKNIQKQHLSVSQNIKDKKLIQNLNKNKEKILQQQLQANADQRFSALLKDIERKIRTSKVSKSRTEKIKIDEIVQTFKIQKSLEKHLKNNAKKN